MIHYLQLPPQPIKRVPKFFLFNLPYSSLLDFHLSLRILIQIAYLDTQLIQGHQYHCILDQLP